MEGRTSKSQTGTSKIIRPQAQHVVIPVCHVFRKSAEDDGEVISGCASFCRMKDVIRVSQSQACLAFAKYLRWK